MYPLFTIDKTLTMTMGLNWDKAQYGVPDHAALQSCMGSYCCYYSMVAVYFASRSNAGLKHIPIPDEESFLGHRRITNCLHLQFIDCNKGEF